MLVSQLEDSLSGQDDQEEAEFVNQPNNLNLEAR